MILELAPKTAVDHVDGDGDTALLVAAQNHRADIPRGMNSRTPRLPRATNVLGLRRLLADHGANVNYVDQRRI
jgi:hypothetical protein